MRVQKWILALGVLAVAGASLAGGGLYYALSLRGPDAPEQVFTVTPGSSTAAIGQQLARDNLVRNKWLFVIAVRLNGLGRRLQAGEFRLHGGMTPLQIARVLASGKVVTYAFTLPEGMTVQETINAMAEKGLGNLAKLSQLVEDRSLVAAWEPENKEIRYALEGYLSPNTYQFTHSMSERQELEMMIRPLSAFWTPERVATARAQGLTVHQAMTLASIVERETAIPEERPLIASVYLNRLKRGMPLQADPTVAYAVRKAAKDLTPADYKAVSPYNTYQSPGLPPGPIANPGEKSIEAVLNPAKTTYLYFVGEADGRHLFANTFQEHLHNVAIAEQTWKAKH